MPIKDPELRRKYNQQYRLEHREKLLAQMKARHARNREQDNLRCREYQAKNAESIRARKAEWKKAKLKSDPYYRAVENLRRRTSAALMGQNKSAATLALIGCSREELRAHIESKWLPGMSWENYGRWHIDHIRPCVSFDLSDSEQQKICFNYQNLQPLWAQDNLSKGGK